MAGILRRQAAGNGITLQLALDCTVHMTEEEVRERQGEVDNIEREEGGNTIKID